jgi:hypothetical protein
MSPTITELSMKLGLSEETVKSGMAALLGLLKERASEADFEKILGLIPGGEQIFSGTASVSSGAGMLGGLLGSAGGFLGGQAGDAVKALSAFQRAGVPVDKIAPFAQAFFDLVRKSGGEEVIGNISESIPALKAILGGK